MAKLKCASKGAMATRKLAAVLANSQRNEHALGEETETISNYLP